MADPITILGAASAVLAIIDVLAKTIRSVSELRSKWNLADLTVSTFEMQLTGLNFALTEIKRWADRNSEDPHYQLAMDIDRCLSHCRLLIAVIDGEIANLRTSEGSPLDVAARIRILFKTQGMSEAQEMIKHVTNTLGLILGACNSISLAEQKAILEKPVVRRALRRVEADTASLIVHRDIDSLRSYSTSAWSSMSRLSATLRRPLSVVFDFDQELFPSDIYRRVFKGSVRESLQQQQGETPVRLSKATRQIIVSTTRKRRGSTGLHYACLNGYLDATEILIQMGANIESMDMYGKTPLSCAAYNGHEAVVKLLLEKEADIESGSGSGQTTPLSWAACNGHEAVVKLLLEKGAEIESKDGLGRTPLSWAAEDGYEAVVKLLLEKDAEIDSKDKDGRTPLSLAARNNREVVVKLLLEKGADIESKDRHSRTPLSRAAEKGREAVIKLLLEKGAEIESKDILDMTPLRWAAESGHEAVVKILLEKGAEIESKDEYGRTPLSWAADKGHEAVIKLLLEKGAEIELKDISGRTPLSWAAENNNEVVVQLLKSHAHTRSTRAMSNSFYEDAAS
ncbi:ankyrin repeat-containing domain protein [Echria macrotheca]|uniref:Ankyrin repeat-containing domain protein n=1 Tax=Echria macrotheca TaxID=438768 RepID=A0AAJ0F7W2_9PEZI|nr:ankyrin repeat-containing domain protein [Echria macrotheca]